MRYFIANGFCPSPHPPQRHAHGDSKLHFSRSVNETRKQMARRYADAGSPLPKLGETVFLRAPCYGRIAVFVYGAYEAFVLVMAQSQRKAYLLGNAFRAVTTCFQGHSPVNNLDAYLLELTVRPNPDMSRRDLACVVHLPGQIGPGPDIQVEMAIGSGTGLDHIQIARACEIAGNALEHPTILDALLHLEFSRTLVWGFIMGSYYDSHYSGDRRELSRYELEGIYLENRFRYDSAFVSAFRGIECILGKPYFKKADIFDLLARTDAAYGTLFSSAKHRSWHEVFSSKRKWWSYVELISYYLKLRNAVSAHGNPSPPHVVMEDQVFEIQFLLQGMIWGILSTQKDDEKTEQEN